MTDKKLSERIEIDDANDSVKIDGVRFTGEGLKFFTQSTRESHWFRLERKDDASYMAVSVRTEEGFK